MIIVKKLISNALNFSDAFVSRSKFVEALSERESLFLKRQTSDCEITFTKSIFHFIKTTLLEKGPFTQSVEMIPVKPFILSQDSLSALYLMDTIPRFPDSPAVLADFYLYLFTGHAEFPEESLKPLSCLAGRIPGLYDTLINTVRIPLENNAETVSTEQKFNGIDLSNLTDFFIQTRLEEELEEYNIPVSSPMSPDCVSTLFSADAITQRLRLIERINQLPLPFVKDVFTAVLHNIRKTYSDQTTLFGWNAVSPSMLWPFLALSIILENKGEVEITHQDQLLFKLPFSFIREIPFFNTATHSSFTEAQARQIEFEELSPEAILACVFSCTRPRFAESGIVVLSGEDKTDHSLTKPESTVIYLDKQRLDQLAEYLQIHHFFRIS